MADPGPNGPRGGVSNHAFPPAEADGNLPVLAPIASQFVVVEDGRLSVIEEECTGNGTLAACRAGVLGDAVVLLEPTGLDLLLGGVGILWVEIEIEGLAAHAEAADRAANPVSRVPVILRALADFESEINAVTDDPAFRQVARPYNVNVGMIRAGDWASSVPARARLCVRVGFPRDWTPDEAFDRVQAAVLRAAGSRVPARSRPRNDGVGASR